MIKHKITLTILSPVICSPRMQGELYNEIDYKKISGDAREKHYEIIYPFYSYDDRYHQRDQAYSKAQAYYLPGSSWKGALQLEETAMQKNQAKKVGAYFICKDIKIEHDQIDLKPLSKYQYLYHREGENKKPKLEEFFPKIGVEMLKSGTQLDGEIIVKGMEANWNLICENINKIAKIKLKRTIEEIERIKVNYETKLQPPSGKESINNDKQALEELFDVRKNLEKINRQIELAEKESRCKAYIFLGGFKGLFHSLSHEIEREKLGSTAFFVDKETKLLYGLVSIEILSLNTDR